MPKLTIGPGALVAAAFIGPGTVTTCTVAGADFGYALLWALLFATLATMALQEMAARLGAAAGRGLGEALRQELTGVLRWPLFGLIGIALYAGNAAYEGGNLSGAALGVAALGFGGLNYEWVVGGMAALAAIVLLSGGYRLVERVLVALVLLMAVAFVGTFTIVGPSLEAMVEGLFLPTVPDGAALTAVALVGTTVVPYNLFLHASAAKARWYEASPLGQSLAEARGDTFLSVGLGGLVSMMIVATAAATMFTQALEVTSASDMAVQLEPIAGAAAPLLVGIGLAAAGLTSSITAPLATGYVVAEVLGWSSEASSRGVRGVACSIIFVGATLAILGLRPVEIILAAQVANGLLLPIIVGFLLFAMNRRKMLGAYANGWKANLIGGAVLVVTLFLGGRAVLSATGVL